MMGSEQYCLKWNNHWANLVHFFNGLRDSGTFVDVTIACEGKQLKAHRLVLSACSPYFKDLLVAHPDRHPIIILKDVRYAELQSLLQFIYNGEVAVERENMSSLLFTAKELQIKGLTDSTMASYMGQATLAKNVADTPIKNDSKSSLVLLSSKAKDVPTDLSINGTSSLSEVHRTPSPSEASFIKLTNSSSTPSMPLESTSVPSTPSAPGMESVLNLCSTPSHDTSPVPKKRRRTDDAEESSIRGSEESGTESDLTKAKIQLVSTLNASSREGHEKLNVSSREDVDNVTAAEETNGVVCHADSNDGFAGSRERLSSSPVKSPAQSTVEILPSNDVKMDEEPLNLRTPEVILEEDETGVVSTKDRDSPDDDSPVVSNSGTPLKEISNRLSPTTGMPQQISFLHQALSMGYPQPLQFLSPGSNSPIPPTGMAQAKNILNFVDLLKAMGGSGIPNSQASLPNLLGPNKEADIPSSLNANSVTSAGYPLPPTSPLDGQSSALTCHICARIMPSRQVLEEHVRIHEEEKPYKCDQCGQRYKYQSAFQRHQEQNHTAKLPGDKPYRCEVCGQCFKYHKSFTKHRANHELLDSFMKTESGADEKGAIRAIQESYLQRLLNPSSFIPPQQGQHTLAPVKMEVKEEESDGGTNSNSKSPCLVSSTSLPGSSSENGEIKEEECDDEDVEVDDVPDVPGEEDEEDNDLDSRTKGKFFYCTQCKLTFRDHESFEGHLRISPSCSSDSLKEVSVGGDISVTSVSNSQSPFSQVSPQPSSSDKSTVLSSSSLLSDSKSSVFTSNPSMLYTFVNSLGGLPQASVPPTILNLSKLVNFNNIPNYSGVMRNPDSLPFSYNSAASGVASSGGVNNILGGIEEERPFKCPYCSKGFKGRENLKLHIRTHTGEKPYNCGVCGKAFGGRSDMNRHLRIHTGEKPYPCKVCGKKFARADYLSKHITTHLGIPFAKPVHSLQQSLQNLENMQNLQNLENMQQNISSLTGNLQASVVGLQGLSSVGGMSGIQSISSLQNLQSLSQLSAGATLAGEQRVPQEVQSNLKEEVSNAAQ